MLNIDQEEYVSQAGDTAGARVLVLPQAVMPFPEDDGVTIIPGKISYVQITKVINYGYYWHLRSM